MRSLLCLALLAVSLQALVFPASGTASVTLKSITIFQKQSWLFYPQIYFRCADGNQTELSFVKQVMHYYPLAGNETWQPLLHLEPHECKQCGVYERLLFGDSRLGQWTLCTSNFSVLDSWEMLTLIANHSVTINAACPECPVEDQQVKSFVAEPEKKPSHILRVLLIVFAVAGGLLLTMTLVTLFVFLRKDSNPAVFEEKSKMLEMDSLGSAPSAESTEDSRMFPVGHVFPTERVGSDRIPHVSYEKRKVSHILRDDPDDDDLV